MFLDEKEISSLRIWELLETVKDQIPGISLKDMQMANSIAALQGTLRQIEDVKNLDSWLFTNDFQSRLRSLEQLFSHLIDAIRAYQTRENHSENEVQEFSAMVEAIIDESRKAGIFNFELRKSSPTEKVIRDFTSAATLGLEQVREQEFEFKADLGRLRDQIEIFTKNLEAEKNGFEQRKLAFDTQLSTLSNTNNEYLAKESKRVSEELGAYLTEAQEKLSAMNKLLQSNKNLADIVYRKFVSDDYGKYSVSQARMGNLYSLLTILAGGGTAYFNSKLLHDLASTSSDLLGLKVLGSFVSIAIFAFVAAETAGYRHQARDAKRTQLDLNAVETAVQMLDPSEGESLRLTVIKETFLRPRPTITRWTDGLFARRPSKD